MSSIKDGILKIIQDMDSMTYPDDPRFDNYFDSLITLLLQDEDETIKLLKSLNKDQMAWITPTWGSISGILQSKKFIDCIIRIGEKYPDIVGIKSDIEDAIEAMD